MFFKSTASQLNSNEEIILNPNPRLSIIIISLGILLIPFSLPIWLEIIIICFGLFLLLQTFILRLEFNKEALVVKQLGKELRTFPFKNWISWRIFLPKLPGILYFREEASPHLLPILFDPTELEFQLRKRVGTLERPQKSLQENSN